MVDNIQFIIQLSALTYLNMKIFSGIQKLVKTFWIKRITIFEKHILVLSTLI